MLFTFPCTMKYSYINAYGWKATFDLIEEKDVLFLDYFKKIVLFSSFFAKIGRSSDGKRNNLWTNVTWTPHEIYSTWLLKVDGHHLKSGIPHDLRVIIWGIDSWSFWVCSHNLLISQRQNIYREKGKPSVVHPLSSSSSTVFLVECRFLTRGQNRSTEEKSSRSKGESQQRTQQCSPTKKAHAQYRE